MEKSEVVKTNEKFLNTLADKYNGENLRDQSVFVNVPSYFENIFADLLGKISNTNVSLIITKDPDDLKATRKKFDSYDIKDIEVQINEKLNPDVLTKLNYLRVNKVMSPGEFSLLGDMVMIWIPGVKNILRISLFQDEVDGIDWVDPVSRRTVAKTDSVVIGLSSLSNESKNEDSSEVRVIYGNENSDIPEVRTFYLLDDKSNHFFETHPKDFHDLGIRSIPIVESHSATGITQVMNIYKKRGYEIWCFVEDIEKVQSVIDGNQEYISKVFEMSDEDGELNRGFEILNKKLVVFSDFELRGFLDLADAKEIDDVTNIDSQNSENTTGGTDADMTFIPNVNELTRYENQIYKEIAPGDYVVHEDHGIGMYDGVVSQNGKIYMRIRYAGADKLFVPLNQASKVTKYVGMAKKIPMLTTLNGGAWRRIKKNVVDDTNRIAKELVQLYAMRSLVKSNTIINDQEKLKEFEQFVENFQYSETEDQILATQDIVSDFHSENPMDRLLVGDVGFGKTEIAMRAAFAVMNAGLQVAVLAPTTILVEQHYVVFKKRFAGTEFRMAALSRLSTTQERNHVLYELEKGNIDLIVGTHSLLSQSVKFHNLGLLVIDEEQKFGVEQKEKIKKKRVETNVLTMSATPIPRTLNMTLSGIRDISLIASPPPGRKAVNNTYAQFSWDVIKDAIQKELDRNGQVYYLHNRVATINNARERLAEMFPDYIIGVAHGQLKPLELARVMRAFTEGKIDILICTTIIENGIDLPNVNTLIIGDSSRLGLSQLYQIRGRIGRSDKQAYAYFLYNSLRGDAGLRLNALKDSEELGSGFVLATRDLEIRGAGNIIGKAQSGVIDSVGYGMYMNLLISAVENLKKKMKIDK